MGLDLTYVLPFLWHSMSLLRLPGVLPYGAPRAAMWALDYGDRAGQSDIYGHCCPGQAYLGNFAGGEPICLFAVAILVTPGHVSLAGEMIPLSTIDNETRMTKREQCNGRVR